MRVKNIAFGVFILVLCVFPIIVGGVVRKSYIDDTDISKYITDNNINFSCSKYEQDATNVFIEAKNLKDVNDLENSSPIIAKVKVDPTVTRIRYYSTTLSKVDVIKLYKGDMVKRSICVFEPIDIITTNNSVSTIDSLEGYNWMNSQKEYILFLRPLKNSHYGEDETIYIPTTTILSKYQVDNKNISKISDDKLLSSSYKYSDVKGNEVIICDDVFVDKFNTFKSKILQKYN